MAIKFLNTVAVDADVLYVDTTNDRVGIGTPSPSFPLHVDTSNDVVAYFKSSDNKASISVADNDTTTWLSAENGRLGFGPGNGVSTANITILQSNYNVGIGTVSPQSKLHLATTGSSTLTIQNTTNSGNAALNFRDEGDNDQFQIYYALGANRSYNLVNGNGLTIYSSQSSSEIARFGNGSSGYTDSYFTGNVGIGKTSPIRKLDVAGITKTVGFQNTDNHTEGFLSATFANGVADQNYDIRLGNFSFWGYIEVEITGTYSNQNTAGKLTKIYAVGTNPAVGSNAGIIYTNDTRVSDSIGTIKDNIALGDLRFDGTDDTGVFAIRVSHIVSTGNGYTIKVRAFTHGSNGDNGAAGILTNLTLSPVYTQASLSRQYVHYNENVGIGTTSPGYPLEISNNAITSLVYQRTGVSANKWGFHSDNDATYWQNVTSGSLLFTLQNGGNVGIGTTSPGARLDVVGAGDAVQIRRSNGFASIKASSDNGGNLILDSFSTSGAVFINNYVNRPVYIATGGGNVGIGTASPAAKLHVSGGDVRLDDGREVRFDVSGTVTASEELIIDAGGTDSKIVLDGADSAMQFITGNSVAINIDDAQKVGVGTTSPSQLLHVAGNMRLQNQLYDSTNSLGSNGEVLTKVSAGTEWKAPAVNAQMPDNTAPASAANVGTIRYRSTSNTSFVDMSMQTGATTYAWVNIVSNFW